MTTPFNYLVKMLQEGTYEYSRYISISRVPLETSTMEMNPYQHRHSGTYYYVIRIPSSPQYHLSIFENEFNNKRFHITFEHSEYGKLHITYYWNGKDFVPNLPNQDTIRAYNAFILNNTVVNELINQYKKLLEAVYHYINETQVGGSINYYHKYAKYKNKYINLKS